MPIRKDGITISNEIVEKLVNITFTNTTNQYYSIEEIYLAKLINDIGISQIKSSYIFDIANKCVRYVIDQSDKIICYDTMNQTIFLDIDKVFLLPTWSELRTWLKNKGFKIEFHYDPFKDEGIKIGFMKPKFLTGTDNLIIEAQGKTDLETLYKVLLEVIKYENNPEA